MTRNLILLGLTVTALAIGGLYFMIASGVHLSRDITDWGNYGSYFGGVMGGLLTPLTIYLVYLTYRSQEQLTKRTISEFKRQAFENHFYDLLQTFNEIRLHQMSTWIREGNNPKEHLIGYKYFRHIFKRLDLKLKQLNNDKAKAIKYVIAWDETQLGLYFGIINQLVTQITINFDNQEAQPYFNVIAAQLSNWEKILINHVHLHRFSDNYQILIENKAKLLTAMNDDVVYDDNYDANLREFVNE
jgi:hypothetical protein